MTEDKKLRRIRSFVLRTGRMTEGQQKAYDTNWSKYGLQLEDGVIDQAAVFGRKAPLVFEIGFGMGQSLAEMAINEPDKDFIGVEVHTPGVAKLMMLIDDAGINNIRVYQTDAIDVLNQCITPESLERFQLYFPDPWHKTKHHKRRIVQPDFIDLIARYLSKNGTMHFATDWEPYAKHMLAVAQSNACFTNTSEQDTFCERPVWRPITKFERRGHRLDHGVWDLIYKRI